MKMYLYGKFKHLIPITRIWYNLIITNGLIWVLPTSFTKRYAKNNLFYHANLLVAITFSGLMLY